MDLKTMIPEMNENQRKWLKRVLLDFVKQSRETSMPLAFIEKKLEELFS